MGLYDEVKEASEAQKKAGGPVKKWKASTGYSALQLRRSERVHSLHKAESTESIISEVLVQVRELLTEESPAIAIESQQHFPDSDKRAELVNAWAAELREVAERLFAVISERRTGGNVAMPADVRAQIEQEIMATVREMTRRPAGHVGV